MKKIILLSAFLFGVALFSLNNSESAKANSLPSNKKWYWDCPVSGCSGGGSCVCKAMQCMVSCNKCGHVLSAADWRTIYCDQAGE